MPYIPHTQDQQKEMLETIGLGSMDELFQDIPETLTPEKFDLPRGRSEMEVTTFLRQLASRNRTGLKSFLGAGFYDHYIPAAAPALVSRSEFYTAYTPYQAEASQGSLQALFEYQTAMARLMDMDYANASVYDGGTAIYEAMMMAVRHTRRKKIVISSDLSPIYQHMLQCYTKNLHLHLETVDQSNGLPDTKGLARALDQETAALIVQNPNFFGSISDYSDLFQQCAAMGAVSIISVYPVLQSVLKTPGEMKADIAVAEGQSLGLPLSFGGPYLGIMTCSRSLIRQMPGRIVGKTRDSRGREGFVLTLQAREQHIRREKATSNICSNQSLCALQALAYICLMGPAGLEQTALKSMELARYAADKLTSIPGVSLLNKAPFGNEFAIRLPVSAYDLVDSLVPRGFVPGFPLGRYYPGLENCLLMACTEKISPTDIGMLSELIRGAL
ncbi:aminomethyl-transferring glycine dehydrogenase subunit GcvPA [Desulfonatronovibrio hydrogenovorans]|uniref:aminomethyl-transferring glycine dehydrogenase subunit GcvPA n=1 Tax=Desulfonatronovibrio hydrogenovorans TaxID=53245 RepID=UPI00048DB50D|nr:aminomethyl-transferring glycine dehydrogenase subunit GcvPA [Desulfonatronovibrio hydrogenovorans]